MTYPIYEFKNQIISVLQNILSTHNVKIQLEKPPENMGDAAFPCFFLAPYLKKSPQSIAEDIARQIPQTKMIGKVVTQGGYVNFFINTELLVSLTLTEILKKKETYGTLKKKKEKVIIEHTSANPNGPLHIGRARNPIIGDSLVRIYRAAGYDVDAQFYLDDMGKQVAILSWGIQNLSSMDFPESKYSKPDHKYVGYYQIANKKLEEDPQVQKEIGEIVKKAEKGETATIDTVQNAYEPVLEGIIQSLNKINIQLDTFIPESTFVKDKSVDDVVKKLKKNPYCKKENGGLFLDLKSFGIKGRTTKFFILRKDGTTLYATRDIAYHLWKAQQADILINILGEDHKLESQQVDIALELLNEKTRPVVVFYAFVSLPGGKMSTRRGRVVYLDELIDECIERAYDEVRKRRGNELLESEMKKIATIVGIGALRYNIIKVQPEKDIVFQWEDALNFEGNAAPFIQYAHARTCGILTKVKETKRVFNEKILIHQSEINLVKHLAQFPLIIEEACNNFKPHIIANFLFETAARFNQFYRDCPVIPEKNQELKNTRIVVVEATRIVLSNALNLLGITAPEEM